MKGILSPNRKYYKYDYTQWEQPLLTSDGGNPNFTVWGSYNRGGPVWRAFATESGYTTNYYVGNYGNEYRTSLYIYMTASNPLLINSYSWYSPTINSNSNWDSILSGELAGSNDGANWTTLHTHGVESQDVQLTFTFDNNQEYRNYRYIMTSKGWGHTDQVNVCSFRLIGQEKILVSADESDYDFYRDTYELPYINNKFYAVKGE